MDNRTFYENLVKQEKDLLSGLEKVRALKKFYEDTFGLNSLINKIPEEKISKSDLISNTDYNPQWNLKDKVLFILKTIGGSGISSEVSAKLVEYEGLDEERAGQIARTQLSLANRAGTITSEPTGQGRQKKYILLSS